MTLAQFRTITDQLEGELKIVVSSMYDMRAQETAEGLHMVADDKTLYIEVLPGDEHGDN